jgi:hypothetical protein
MNLSDAAPRSPNLVIQRSAALAKASYRFDAPLVNAFRRSQMNAPRTRRGSSGDSSALMVVVVVPIDFWTVQRSLPTVAPMMELRLSPAQCSPVRMREASSRRRVSNR